MSAKPDEIREFLASFPRPAADVAMALRALVRRHVPEATEALDRSARVIGFSVKPGYAGLVCTIIPGRNGVKLGIVDGAALADPYGLLEGTGKRHRHIQFRNKAELEHSGVRQLIEAAREAARVRAGA